MKPQTKPRPLWRCPKCGKYYVTRNMWHTCARHTLAEHFAGRNPVLRSLFDGLVALLRPCGPVSVMPGKTGIAFQQRVRFAGVFVRKNHLEAGFTLTRRIEHARFRQILAVSPAATITTFASRRRRSLIAKYAPSSAKLFAPPSSWRAHR